MTVTSGNVRPNLYLIDASIYIFRAYFSMPSSMMERDGEVNHAVYGFTQFLLDFLEFLNKEPDGSLVSVAYDESLNTCYRNAIFPDYKTNRDEPDDNMMYQVARCQEVTGLLGLHFLSLYDYEADDIIGTIAHQMGESYRSVILTRDKDLGQLLSRDDVLWDFAAGTTMDGDAVTEKFGVRPDQIADYLALAGDTVDNIPGVNGVGGKTAAALLTNFNSIDELFERVSEVSGTGIRGASKLQEKLENAKEDVRLYQSITAINLEAPLTVDHDLLIPGRVDVGSVMAFCERMNFGNRIRDRVQQLG